MSDDFKIHGIKRGTVVDNIDPLKTGCVKVLVHDIMQGITADSIPWAKPLWSSIVGGSAQAAGYFAVPDVNSEVFVIFENGDPLSPIYVGAVTDGVHGLPGFKNEDYPEVKGIRFKNGFEVFLNQKKDLFRINHPTGMFFEISKEGKVTIDTKSSVNIQAVGEIKGVSSSLISFTAPNVSMIGTYGMKMECPATITIEAPTFRVTGNPVFDVGWTGVFSTGSGQAVTVTNGIITEIA